MTEISLSGCPTIHSLSLSLSLFFFCSTGPSLQCEGFSSFGMGLIAPQHEGSWFPDQGSNPCPLHWKAGGFSTTGPPGKPPHVHVILTSSVQGFHLPYILNNTCFFSIKKIIAILMDVEWYLAGLLYVFVFSVEERFQKAELYQWSWGVRESSCPAIGLELPCCLCWSQGSCRRHPYLCRHRTAQRGWVTCSRTHSFSLGKESVDSKAPFSPIHSLLSLPGSWKVTWPPDELKRPQTCTLGIEVPHVVT